jgi:hypothetical protein
MKTMTCKELGQSCDQKLSAASWGIRGQEDVKKLIWLKFRVN